jgi:lysophospholipase L1-like esterase
VTRLALPVLVVLATVAACAPVREAVAPPAEDPPRPSRYVAVGDSLATGAGAQRGYAERYADHLRADGGGSVRFTNFARDGWTSADLLAALEGDPRFADALTRADVVTIDIGGNDLLRAQAQFLAGECSGEDCLHDAVDAFQTNWDAIVVAVDRLVAEDTVLITMDLYNPFVAPLRAFGLYERLQPFLDRVNEHIRRSAAEHGMTVAPVHAAFNGPEGLADPVVQGLIAEDRLHPSDAGHAVIAELLAEHAGGS